MAIVQISRIQVRRGLQQDLPQLAAGEMGWSTDDQRLYIGNGVTGAPDYAPAEGVTEIVTAPNLTSIGTNLLKYTFKGTDAGYTSSTSGDPLNPIQRSLQSVLDEWISVKDFGAKGDGATDDTAAINRAISEIYTATLNKTTPAVRRTIKLPAGTYKVTSSILVPENCQLVGDGKNNTIISGGDIVIMRSCDSNFVIQGGLGFGVSADLPSYITIKDLALRSTSTTNPLVALYSATNVQFDRVKFDGGSYGLAVDGASDAIATTTCTFINGASGTISQSSIVTGMVSRSSYLDTIRVPLYNGPNTVTTLSSGSGKIDYEIFNGSNYRIGTLKYNLSGGVVAWEDEFSEPTSTLNANLFVANSGAITCAVSSSATLKYNIKQFI